VIQNCIGGIEMSKNLLVKITKRTTKGIESWEGTANLPGVLPTKLTKSKTNESKFSTRSALTSAAQRLATRYGFSDVQFEGVGTEKTVAKKTSSPRRTKNSETSEVSESLTV
jgi:hypothetical protein